MTKAVAEIVRRARSLSADERLEVLIELLNQGGEVKPDSEILTNEFKDELRSRSAFMDAHPDQLVPMAEAHNKVRESHKHRRGS
jgi:hypothetical protein